MHPRAASVYLPAQNAVADDFLKLIDQLRNEHNEVENFYEIIYRYTMECKCTLDNQHKHYISKNTNRILFLKYLGSSD